MSAVSEKSDDKTEQREPLEEVEIEQEEGQQASVEIDGGITTGEKASTIIGDGIINNNYFGPSWKELLGWMKELPQGISDPLSSQPLDPSSQEKLNEWFMAKGTTDREKYYAVTLSMFNGLNYPDFKDIYEIICLVMDVEKVEDKVCSPFLLNDESLTTNVGAEIVPTGSGVEEIIKFQDDNHAIAIFQLMRRRYRNILLDLLPALKKIVEEHRYWEVRYRAAMAVAEIGKLGFHRMRKHVLEPWAADKRDYVRATVGYPLTKLAKDTTTRSSVKDLLDEWSNLRQGASKDVWRYYWTVASVYKEIGIIREEWAGRWLNQGLRQVAGFNDIRVAGAVSFTLIVLSLRGQLVETVCMLRDWVEERKANNCRDESCKVRFLVAIQSFIVLADTHKDLSDEESKAAKEAEIRVDNLLELIQQARINKENLWESVIVICVSMFEDELATDGALPDEFFELVIQWAKQAENNPHRQKTLVGVMTEVFSQLETRNKQLFWNVLRRWGRQNHDKYLSDIVTLTKSEIKRSVL